MSRSLLPALAANLVALAVGGPLAGQDLAEGLLSGPVTWTSTSYGDSERPGMRPPPGVEYAELLSAEQFEFSWQWTGDLGDGARAGTRNVSKETVFGDGFEAFPRNWRRNEHRFGFYYGASDVVTLALLVPLVETEVKFEAQDGATYREDASGLGDFELSALYSLKADERESLSVGTRVTLPIGSIDEEQDNPFSAGLDQRQPYSVQPGSGTLALAPAVTWQRWFEFWSCGARVSYDANLGSNQEGWSPGDAADIDVWFAQRLTRDHSVSLRLHGARWDSIDGADDALVQSLSPLHIAANSGGTSIDIYAGVNMVGIEGHRFALEVGGPIYQDLDGLQAERDVSYRLGWRYSF
jgi:hypothetical protein